MIQEIIGDCGLIIVAIVLFFIIVSFVYEFEEKRIKRKTIRLQRRIQRLRHKLFIISSRTKI
jgi:ABC-type multidrug transport system permease subunit